MSWSNSIDVLQTNALNGSNSRVSLTASMACPLVQDKICVVGNALLSDIAVELASVSIQGTYKVDIGFDFDRAKHVSSKGHSAII